MIEENNQTPIQRPHTGNNDLDVVPDSLKDTNDLIRRALVSRTKEKVKERISKEEQKELNDLRVEF